MHTIEKLIGDCLKAAGLTLPVVRGEQAPDNLALPYVLVHAGPSTKSAPGRAAWPEETWIVERVYVDVYQRLGTTEDPTLRYRLVAALDRAQPAGVVSPVVVEAAQKVNEADPTVEHWAITVRLERDITAAIASN